MLFNGVAVETNRPVKPSTSIFPRGQQLRFIRAIMGATSMDRAAAIVRLKARTMPEGTGPNGWRGTFEKLADILEGKRDALNIISLDGNSKLPFASFSTLPFATCPGMGACATFCYSTKAWQYPAAMARQIQNTMLIQFDPERVKRAFDALPQGITLRLYVDGDFDSPETFGFWMQLLKTRPDISAYGYSKSWDIIRDWDGGYPDNYRLNLSSGGAHQRATVADMMALPITRGQFVAVKIGHYEGETRGFERYDVQAYHAEVRRSAAEQGLGKVFSCPGKCGECASGKHACGSEKFRDRIIAIGVH